MKKNLIEDKKANTKSFFFTKDAEVFDYKEINFLIKFYSKYKKDIRICLHPNKKTNHHDMIILQQKKNFYPPHKHKKKGETYHIIKGSMACILFTETGKIKKVCLLKKNNIFRTPINVFHTMLPLTTYVIYHESKVGPFLKVGDSLFSKWSKKLTKDQKKIEAFKKFVFKKAEYL